MLSLAFHYLNGIVTSCLKKMHMIVIVKRIRINEDTLSVVKQRKVNLLL